MPTARTSLPSAKAMKDLCHESSSRWLPLQAFSLSLPVALAFLVFCTVIAVFTAGQSFARGDGFGGASVWFEWLQSSLVYAGASAGAIVGLVIFAHFYLRGQFGGPAYFCEMQADLSSQNVVRMGHAYLHSHSIDDVIRLDHERGRVIAKIDENNYSRSFLEITAVPIDNETTWIVVRSASVASGRATLFSAFFNDFGASRQAANEMMEIFSSSASSKRRRAASQKSSQQAIPRVQPVNACPPPASKRLSPSGRVPSAGWRRAARLVYGQSA